MMAFPVLFPFLIILSICQITIGYSLNSIATSSIVSKSNFALYAGSDSPPLNEKTKERIDTLVNGNKVLLFMKGNKLFPQW
jgi:hypothetical protein